MKEIQKVLNQIKKVVFIDFEGSQFSQEIIAIGAIKCTLDNKNFVKETSKPLKIYIKIDEPIGPFIEQLTGISDEFLNNNGISFKDAMKRLQDYVGKEKVKYFSYGNFDIHLLHNSMIKNEMKTDEFVLSICQNLIDFSKIFSKYVKSENNTVLSLIAALKVFQTNIESDLHDPVNDAINLMHLYNAFLTKKNILKNEYICVITKSPSLPNPYRKMIKKLQSEQKVTYKDFLSYVEEDLK